jgi:hypothetical protein
VKVTRRLRDQLSSAAREAADLAREKARDRLGPTLGRGEEPAPAPARDAPGNRPRAAFAGVLDGRHLWLAVDATPGSLALREAGIGSDAGGLLQLASDLAEDDPRYRSVRTDLTAVAGEGSARFEVVVTAPGGKVYRVWTPPLARNEPVRTPAVGGVLWELARSADGTLELVREPAPAGAVLLDIDIDIDDVTTLRIGGAAAGAELRLVDDESGEVLVTRSLDHEGGVATGTLSPADVPERVGLSAAVHAGDLPVRRRANDLARPDNAVLLPQVQNDSDEEDAPLFAVTFRWLPDGILRVRRPKGRPQDASQDVSQEQSQGVST